MFSLCTIMNYYNYFWLIGVHSISDVKQKIKRSNLIFVCFIILRVCYDHPFPWTVLLTLPFIEKAQVIKKVKRLRLLLTAAFWLQSRTLTC